MKTPKGIATSFTQAVSMALLLGPAACAPDGMDPEDPEIETYDSEGSLLEDKALLAAFQAEARTASSGCEVATNHSGYTGAGFIDYGGNGTWIEWNNVNVTTAGQYSLTFRYANASSSPRSSAAYVNGANVGNVAFNATGAWTTWGTASITATLRAGNNTIRIMANTSNGGPNLDRMDVSSTATTPPPSTGITYVGTTKVWDSNGQDLTIARPSGIQSGDLLVLVLHRTDDDLPLYVDGWTRGAECFKRDNGYDCSTKDDCTIWESNGKFCKYFGSEGQGGHDLAQAVFYKAASSSEPSSYRFSLNMDTTGHPGWAILTALRGAATTNPIRDWANEGCDNNPDSLFPSVYGQAGDMVLLSQSYDDRVDQAVFGAPPGATTFGYISNSDEAGFLYGKKLTATGETGSMKTSGDGASSCKDGLVSMTIKPK